MKLIINFDFIEAVRNVNEPFNTYKIIRNNKARWAKINLPLYTTINLVCFKNIPEAAAVLGIQFGLIIGSELITTQFTNTDPYAIKSSNNLKELSKKLNALSIETDYNLLLQSEQYDKKYNIEFNENKIPLIAESKYILVPTYTYDRRIKDTSILQEHVIGSKVYTLSLGSPNRQFKFAYSHA